MPFRVSTTSNFTRVLAGMAISQAKLVRAHEQIASGRRILRPSDDPVGAARVLSISERVAEVTRFRATITTGLPLVDTAASALLDASSLTTDARELILKGMNGSLSQSDRQSLVKEMENLRDELVEIANTQVGDRFLFGGTLTDAPPWSEKKIGGFQRVVYGGNREQQKVRIGVGLEVAVNVPGSNAFGKLARAGTTYAGLTGLAGGVTADEGTAYEYVELRHDATDPGSLATAGIALANGGASDTILGDQTLVLDVDSGTIRLGDGPPRKLPDPADPIAADFVLANELGGELHLDLTGWTGASFTGTVRGEGSISIDGKTFVPLSFTETDLELRNPETGAVIHVDTTQVGRAGRELTTFSGAINLFDVLQGVVEDLANADDLTGKEIAQRLEVRLQELDRGHDDLLIAVGTLGERSGRMKSSERRLDGVALQLETFLSDTRDADFSEVVVEMAQAELTLQAAQMTGARLIQNTLLNFLR